MRFSFATLAYGASVLLLACNKHDAGTKPPALNRPQPTSVSPLDAGAAGSLTAETDAATEAGGDRADAGPVASGLDPSRAAERINETTAVRTASATPCRVLVVGDSLSDPKSNGGGYLKPWARSCPHCQFTNIARGGAMVNQMLHTLREHLATNPPTYSAVVVFGGVNDLYSNETAHRTNGRIERDLSSIYRLARSHADRVFAITVSPWGGFRRWYSEERGRNTRALNDWIRDSVARHEVDAVIDSVPLLTCGDHERLCPEYMAPHRDGLHFGPGGHKRLGAAILRVLGDGCS